MNERSDPHDDFLWDPAAAEHAAVATVESRLAPLRFDADARPLTLPARTAAARPRRAALRWGLAIAASLAVALAGAAWRKWTWPDRQPWPMTVHAAAASRAGELRIGEPFIAGADAQTTVQVARIGTMDVAPGSQVTLRSTTSSRHRLVLARGTVDVRVWAPSGWLGVQTPAGDVIDLGCVFRLSVADDGTARISVQSGWVQLENFGGETLVPAGASSEMRIDASPLVPVYDAASPRFRAGVRMAEQAARANSAAALDLAFLGDASPRDVLTLLVLSRSLPAGAKSILLSRARDLVAPPHGVSVAAIVAGDDRQLWAWYDALDLPSPKHWWLNWRDARR